MTTDTPARPAQRHSFGLRGRRLKERRESDGIGQRHVAEELGIPQPALSYVEDELYGASPRGLSRRFLEALERITAAAGSSCWVRGEGRVKGCGCTRWKGSEA